MVIFLFYILTVKIIKCMQIWANLLNKRGLRIGIKNTGIGV